MITLKIPEKVKDYIDALYKRLLQYKLRHIILCIILGSPLPIFTIWTITNVNIPPDDISYRVSTVNDRINIWNIPNRPDTFQIILPSTDGSMAVTLFIDRNDLIKFVERVEGLLK